MKKKEKFKTRPYQFRCENWLFNSLSEIAEKRGLTMTDVVKTGLAGYYKIKRPKESIYESDD